MPIESERAEERCALNMIEVGVLTDKQKKALIDRLIAFNSAVK